MINEKVDAKTNGEDSAFAGIQSINNQRNNGLTKREYFAAMAMQGLCSDPNVCGFQKIAEFSVQIADALLNELSK